MILFLIYFVVVSIGLQLEKCVFQFIVIYIL